MLIKITKTVIFIWWRIWVKETGAMEMSEFYGGEQKIINSQEALDFKTRPTREIKIAVPKNTTSYYKITEHDDRYRVERIDKEEYHKEG